MLVHKDCWRASATLPLSDVPHATHASDLYSGVCMHACACVPVCMPVLQRMEVGNTKLMREYLMETSRFD